MDGKFRMNTRIHPQYPQMNKMCTFTIIKYDKKTLMIFDLQSFYLCK